MDSNEGTPPSHNEQTITAAPTGATAAAVLRDGGLVMGRSGAWFVCGGRERVSLHTRVNLTVLLRCLSERRERAPGVAVTPAEIIEIMWPGEKILRRAARNRLHVAIRTVRAMGLQDVLLYDGKGYLFDPAVAFARVDD